MSLGDVVWIPYCNVLSQSGEVVWFYGCLIQDDITEAYHPDRVSQFVHVHEIPDDLIKPLLPNGGRGVKLIKYMVKYSTKAGDFKRFKNHLLNANVRGELVTASEPD